MRTYIDAQEVLILFISEVWSQDKHYRVSNEVLKNVFVITHYDLQLCSKSTLFFIEKPRNILFSILLVENDKCVNTYVYKCVYRNSICFCRYNHVFSCI